MKILRVVGLALLIIVLKFLVPSIFHAMENATVALFNTAETTFKEVGTAKALEGLPVPRIR